MLKYFSFLSKFPSCQLTSTQKRRELEARQEREKEVIRDCRTLFEVGFQHDQHRDPVHRPTSADSVNTSTAGDYDHDSRLDIEEQHELPARLENSETQTEACAEMAQESYKNQHLTENKPRSCGVDIELCPSDIPTKDYIEDMIWKGPLPHLKYFLNDFTGRKFLMFVLKVRTSNGESESRRWLVFSPGKQSLYCIPCRLFSHTVGSQLQRSQSIMASTKGWGTEQKWKKLFDRLPQHENSTAHKNCYLAWRELEKRLESDTGSDVMSHKVIMSETEKWRNILTRIIDVIIFLDQGEIALRGSSQ
ncbi:zinc finger MYM-type protein 5-like [Limulus polyphemus]|uniref:Zinc finger MYM-type protein 5-like n=1 Tax=Limulus polyphemus TaxID=6850 RepID=A0ABM1BH40_LIMPO|nr:zinc finger MYM-type protein 5-like [Limulus polyphemus]